MGMNKNVKMSKKFTPRSRSARNFREPALSQGLEHAMKLVDEMEIEAENMSRVNREQRSGVTAKPGAERVSPIELGK